MRCLAGSQKLACLLKINNQIGLVGSLKHEGKDTETLSRLRTFMS